MVLLLVLLGVGTEPLWGAAGLTAALPTGMQIYRRLLKPLFRLILAIGIGLLLGNLIEGSGLTGRLGRLAMPLVRWGHLREQSAVAFTTAFFSSVTANTMLMNSYQEQAISRQELILSSLVLTLPTFFLHLPTTFFIITPLVGRIGVYYLAVLLAAALLRTVAFLTYSRLKLPPPPVCPECASFPRPDWPAVWRQSWPKFTSRFRQVLLVTVPVFLLVFLAQEGGFFEWLKAGLARNLPTASIPVESLSIIALALAAETTAGFAAAGAFLEAQALSPPAILLTLLVGTILSSPIRALRHQLPHYLGIFTPALGFKIMLLSQLCRALSILPFLLLLYFGDLPFISLSN
ncbi:MAG: nucleoside recognition protein [Desulfobacteraceae bacterium]